MPLTDNDVMAAIVELSTLPYFPSGDFAQAAIGGHLRRITDNPKRLAWTIGTFVAKVGQWEGVSALRALYSTRWKPLDGIEGGPCAIAGLTPSDCESRALQAHADLKALPTVDVRRLLQ